MDHPDSSLDSIERSIKTDFRSINEYFSAITTCLTNHIHSEKNFHQGTFPSTIFSYKTKNFTLMHFEVDIEENLVSEKILADIPHFQQWSSFFFHLSILKLKQYESNPGNGEYAF